MAAAAILVQLAIGAVYAWSVFVTPFRDQMGWNSTEAALPFIVTIGILFLGTFVGGRIQDRIGPRPVALTGVAWSIGGVVGPLAIAAIHDAVDSFALPFYLIAAMCLLSMALPLTTRKPAEREVALEQQPTEA